MIRVFFIKILVFTNKTVKFTLFQENIENGIEIF
jgi:hypothetical protein